MFHTRVLIRAIATAGLITGLLPLGNSMGVEAAEREQRIQSSPSTVLPNQRSIERGEPATEQARPAPRAAPEAMKPQIDRLRPERDRRLQPSPSTELPDLPSIHRGEPGRPPARPTPLAAPETINPQIGPREHKQLTFENRLNVCAPGFNSRPDHYGQAESGVPDNAKYYRCVRNDISQIGCKVPFKYVAGSASNPPPTHGRYDCASTGLVASRSAFEVCGLGATAQKIKSSDPKNSTVYRCKIEPLCNGTYLMSSFKYRETQNLFRYKCYYFEE